MAEKIDSNESTHYVYYHYSPSLAGAAIFVVLFLLTTSLHIFQIVKKRTWYFIPLAIGGLFEIVGYIGRIASSKDKFAMPPYLIQNLLLLIAPALFAASIYIILSRIMILVNGERYSMIKQGWLTRVFVTGDVLSFLVQGGGGGIMGSSGGKQSMMDLGEKLILVGLFVQLFFFGAFVVVAGIFRLRLERARKDGSLGTFLAVDIDTLPWQRHLVALYVASGLILVRSVVRVVQYLQGQDGFLLAHEIFLYVFDTLLMLGVMVAFNWVHPSQVTEAYQQRINGATAVGPLIEDSGSIDMKRPKEQSVTARPWV